MLYLLAMALFMFSVLVNILSVHSTRPPVLGCVLNALGYSVPRHDVLWLNIVTWSSAQLLRVYQFVF